VPDRSGSSDSAAAIVAISAPTNANTTITTPVSTLPMPSGAKPPSSVRCEKPTPVVNPAQSPSDRRL
jgi:hypothetical protein